VFLGRIGILDVFLSVVAKALTVQVKVKAREGKGVTSVTLATAIHPRDPTGRRWWLRGCITRKLAEDIIQLIKDMSSVSPHT
jgi:E3 ubiquitin-protein ligase MYCBP2